MEQHAAAQPSGDSDGRSDPRASALLVTTTASLHELLLDPGDVLSVADDPSVADDASFMRAFVPVHAYQRLCATNLDGLTSTIARNPDALRGRIIVRSLPDDSGHYVVIDGSRHVAALRRLAETGTANGVGLSLDVVKLFDACPVTIVQPATDPAFVLALLADANEPGSDPWLHGQRDHLLRLLADQGVHHSTPTVATATAGNSQTLRRYHGYRALGQLMQLEAVPLHEAVELYPLFHAAVGRSVIRTWLDWDDTLCRFLDDTQLERFYGMLQPTVRHDGTLGAPCITRVDDIAQLCDVLAEPTARAVLLERGGTLVQAVAVINAGAFRQWSAQVEEATQAMQWERRRFGRRA